MPDSADPINPYQSPAPAGQAVTTLTADQHRQVNLLRDFRSQIAALGVCWIVFGVIALSAGTYAAALSSIERVLPKATIAFLVTLNVLGLVWLALGVLVYRRQTWALYAALGLTYLALLGNIAQCNMLGTILIGAVVFQAHRVLYWAVQLKRAGISLTARPLELLNRTESLAR